MDIKQNITHIEHTGFMLLTPSSKHGTQNYRGNTEIL